MKTLLTLLAIANMNTVDSHSTEYNTNPITYNGLVYQIEEDYSVSVQYVPTYVKDKNGQWSVVNEDLSLSKLSTEEKEILLLDN